MSIRTGFPSLLILVLFAGIGTWSAPSPSAWAAAPPVKEPEIQEILGYQKEENVRLKKALSRTVDFPGIDDPRTTLGDALERVAKLARPDRLRFHINEKAFTDEKIADVLNTKIAAEVAIPPVKTSLEVVLRKFMARIPSDSGAIYIVRLGAIEITTQAAWLKHLGLPLDTTSPLIEQRFKNVKLSRAMEVIAQEARIGLLIDIRSEKKTRIKISARLEYVPADAALKLLADMAGLVVVETGGVCYVTEKANADRLKKAQADRRKHEPDVPPGWSDGREPGLRALPEKTSLKRAIEAVARQDAGVNVLIDARIEKQTRVRVATVKLVAVQGGVPVAVALELLADMAGLAVVKTSNVYYVTSQGNARRLKAATKASDRAR